MLTEASPASRYALSFISGALLMREALIAAPIYLREHDWAVARELIEKDNLLQSRTVASGHRLAREAVQRLAVLDDADKLVASLQHQERLAIGGGASVASQQIAIDLDDGVKVNYPKFGAALKRIPGLEAAE
jgi:hypothetical protein